MDVASDNHEIIFLSARYIRMQHTLCMCYLQESMAENFQFCQH
uniref:Uncharacterized protein n=1 Tax=Arundo donax TaxID=35708 RepID=A0A0A9SV58_ARUDO